MSSSRTTPSTRLGSALSWFVPSSNLRRAQAPGNVVLRAGEAGLPKESVVNVTQINAIDRDYFLDPIGAVSAEKLDEILQGVWFLLEPSS